MNDVSDFINPLIDAGLEASIAAEPKRTYLGASEIGDECERKLAFKWHGFEGKPFEGRGIRRFRMGHIHEDETARWLKLAGFQLKGEQIRFHLADGKFSGGVDGVIIGGPPSIANPAGGEPLCLPYPLLWEHKIMKSNLWRECKRGGVEKTNPKYFAQAQIYDRQFLLANTLFTALNTDTSELYFELFPYEGRKAETYIDRARRILTSGSPEELPRLCHNAQDFNGKFCPFKERCWEIPKKAPAHTPTWLKR